MNDVDAGYIIGEAARLTSGYYLLLDAPGQALVCSLMWVTSSACAVTLTTKLMGCRAAQEDDPLQVVLTEQVRAGRQVRRTEIPPAAKAKGYSAPAGPGIKSPHKAASPPERILKSTARSAGRLAHLMRPAAGELALASASFIRGLRVIGFGLYQALLVQLRKRPDAHVWAEKLPRPEGGRNRLGEAGPFLGVVAEADFIRSATADDLRSVGDAFGFAYVADETYREALFAHEGGSRGAYGILMPVTVEPGKVAYSSVALALNTKSAVLSDSLNVRAVCEGLDVPCLGLMEWRNLSRR